MSDLGSDLARGKGSISCSIISNVDQTTKPNEEKVKVQERRKEEVWQPYLEICFC